MGEKIDSGCIVYAGVTKKGSPSVFYAVSRSVSSRQKVNITEDIGKIEIRPIDSSDEKTDLGCHSIRTFSNNLLVCGNGEHVSGYDNIRSHPSHIENDMKNFLKTLEDDYVEVPRVLIMSDSIIGSCTGIRYGSRIEVNFSDYRQEYRKQAGGLFVPIKTYKYHRESDVIEPGIHNDIGVLLDVYEPKEIVKQFFDRVENVGEPIITTVAAVCDNINGWELAVRSKY